MKPHVLILPRWYPNTKDIQLGIFIREQAILMAKSYTVSVLYVQHDPTLSQAYTVQVKPNSGITEISVTFKTYAFLKKVRHFFSYRKAQIIGYKQIKSPINLCHVHVPIRPSFLALKLKKRGIPFLITEHWSGHLNQEFSQKSIWYKMYYKYVLKQATRLTTVSAFLQQKFKSNTGFNSTVTPNYIQSSTSTFHNKNQSIEGINILTVSDFNDETKNITGLLHAFSAAQKKESKLRLTIVGDGPDRQKINKLIHDLNLSDAVNWLGRLAHEAVLEQMHNCQFYVSNSNVESFGMTIAEAIMAGKPVIATKSGGPEAFVNLSNGILIECRQPDQLTRAILKMAGNFSTYNSDQMKQAIIDVYGKTAIHNLWDSIYKATLPESFSQS